MISATRREALLGVAAVPAAASVPRLWSRTGVVLVMDPDLAASRDLVETYRGKFMPIEGDRIRFARSVFERRPSMVLGMSRPADYLLIEDVGREFRYQSTAEGLAVLEEIVTAARMRDRGSVIGWVLAPR